MVQRSVEDALQLCSKNMVQQSKEGSGGTICMQLTAWQRLQRCVPQSRCQQAPSAARSAASCSAGLHSYCRACRWCAPQRPAARTGAAAGSRPLRPHALHKSQSQPLCTQLQLGLTLIISAGRGNARWMLTNSSQHDCCQQQPPNPGTGRQWGPAQTTKPGQRRLGMIDCHHHFSRQRLRMHAQASPAGNAVARWSFYAWHRQPALTAGCTAWGKQAPATGAGSSPQQDCHQLQPLPGAQAASAAGSAVGARSRRTLH